MWKKWVASLAMLVILVPVVACEAMDTERPAVLEPEQAFPYDTKVVADHLDVPWAIDVAADGRIFFTERPGRVRVIQEGKLLSEPVISFPAPFISEGEGGLLGLALDPQFTENHYLYVYHTYVEGDTVYNRVLRLREENNRAGIDKVLLDKIPGSGIHNGGRVKIGPDQLLYITTGDARTPELAQDRNSLAGKILRIRLDGTLPADNPFPGSPVYSWGHRNPQGLAWNPVNGFLYSSEHGQSAHDEINRIQSGANYGWPVIQGDQQKEGMTAPILHSAETTWAPSGMSFITKGPWANQLLVANLRGMQLQKITLDAEQPDQVKETAVLWQGEYGRLRDVFEAKDGTLYLLTNNRDGRGTPVEADDRIIQLAAKQP
ncbi:PQQ-dependent sugar dehydrogenase [Brevibacillus nitrificans]|uniref:PQQ-dependent sugar dehydrogenase n=1 Tax=Brevibacillus nitrificans TaxID=651560 RepID=UPI002863E9A1|nr:PQQ-dependent sugar dehydrogenase [Brevibacillus nitrificans]MDR7315371.1 glucose/arabinose dehydrogenase [Brevibacillus nitrificans]